MKDETGGVAIEEYTGLNQKMHSFLVDDNSQHKKAKAVNKNVVTTITHNEYQDVLLSNKCLRHFYRKFKVKIIERELIKPRKFYCFALMAKYISKAMD